MSEPGQAETAEGTIGWAVLDPDGEVVATGPPAVTSASADAGQEP